MTVKELITELQKKPEDADVLVCLTSPDDGIIEPLWIVCGVDTKYGDQPVLYLGERYWG